MDRDFKAQFRAQGIAERKRQTRKRNEQRRREAAEYAEYLRRKDAKQRRANRKHICVSEGLIRCRKQRKLNQTDFANFLGISRRALVNYENGRRAVGGDVLEKILADGEIEMHDIFNLNPDPVPISTRLEIAELTAKLIAACRDECPNIDIGKVLSLVPRTVAHWPKSRRTSCKNIEKAALEILDDVGHWEEAEAYWDQQSEMV
ncbi:helix-turn-helix domain-containing protein [Leisingera sp. S232]|uniref:helix-turn-helix domain-containing protein n=1 Tax=Leisingera sp. S232 TaxID=3415132 RepID=UPI003C7EC437